MTPIIKSGSVTAAAAAPASTNAAASSDTDDSDGELTSSDLYTLTETELQTLLSKGSITRQAYNTELTRRGGGAESEAAQRHSLNNTCRMSALMGVFMRLVLF